MDTSIVMTKQDRERFISAIEVLRQADDAPFTERARAISVLEGYVSEEPRSKDRDDFKTVSYISDFGKRFRRLCPMPKAAVMGWLHTIGYSMLCMNKVAIKVSGHTYVNPGDHESNPWSYMPDEDVDSVWLYMHDDNWWLVLEVKE